MSDPFRARQPFSRTYRLPLHRLEATFVAERALDQVQSDRPAFAQRRCLGKRKPSEPLLHQLYSVALGKAAVGKRYVGEGLRRATGSSGRSLTPVISSNLFARAVAIVTSLIASAIKDIRVDAARRTVRAQLGLT